MSIIGEKLATDEAMGILNTYKAYHKLNKQIDILNKQRLSGKIIDGTYTVKKHNIEEMQKEILNAVRLQEKELERYKEINKKYHGEENDKTEHAT